MSDPSTPPRAVRRPRWLSASIACLFAAAPAASMTITVTSSADTTADDGACTLREAIIAGNTNLPSGAMPGECAAGDLAPTVDTIAFDVGGGGPVTILPGSGLPTLLEPMLIDGYTQPGSSPNTLAVGTDAVLQVEIDGSNAGSANGIWVFGGVGNGSTIRGLVVNRFSASGIAVDEVDVTVVGNFVGTDRTGTQAAPNINGIFAFPQADGCVVGSPAPADRNLVSGNTGTNVVVLGDGCQVSGNLIGTDAAGSISLPSQLGVGTTSGTGILIGGLFGGGNVIAGHSLAGIWASVGSTDLTVLGNLVGMTADGSGPLPNAVGIRLSALGGSDVLENVVASSAGAGISIVESSGFVPVQHRVQANLIHGNGGLAIDLGEDGVTPNDALDDDDGPNLFQNYPVVQAVTDDGTTLEIEWSLASLPTHLFDLDFYFSTTCGPSGFGEAELYLGALEDALSDGAGMAGGVVSFPSPGGPGVVTATATDREGNTSELSPCSPAGPSEIPTLSTGALWLLVLLIGAAGRALLARRL